MPINFIEDTKLTGMKVTDEGYLVGHVNCARTGIQLYRGDEVGRPEMDIVRVYRPEQEVFSTDSLRTIAGKPITNDHPKDPVTPATWKDVAVGSVGNEVLRNGEKMQIPIMLMDASAIAEVKSGKRELSNGYSMDLVFGDGVTPDGEPYDAMQTKIKMNHVAIVQRGRAGHECRIGDSAVKWGVSPLIIDNEVTKVPDNLRKVTVDGLSVETTDQGAQAITKLITDKTALATQIETMTQDHKTALDEKDKELAAKDAKIDKLEKAQLDASAIDVLVAERSDLVSNASKIAKDADFSGMDNNEIRKTAVIAAIGADKVGDKPQSYIDARFEILCEDMGNENGGDSVSDAFKNRKSAEDGIVKDNGQAAYEKELTDSWKTAGVQ